MVNPPSRTEEFVITDIDTEPHPSDADYLAIDPMINQVAATEWKNSTIFEVEDMAQELWLWALSNWKHLDGRDADLQFYMLRRAARAWAKKERVEYMYATGAFIYSPKLIRGYLDTSVFCEPELAVDIDARVDILGALEKISVVRHAAIYKRYALKEDLNTNETRTCNKGISDITDILNGGLDMKRVDLEFAIDEVAEGWDREDPDEW